MDLKYLLWNEQEDNDKRCDWISPDKCTEEQSYEVKHEKGHINPFEVHPDCFLVNGGQEESLTVNFVFVDTQNGGQVGKVVSPKSVEASKYMMQSQYRLCGAQNVRGTPCQRISPCAFHQKPNPPNMIVRKQHWTAEEHINFLRGVHSIGKGRWKEISGLIQTKTPLQVKQHAKRYFHRALLTEHPSKRNRSINDISIADLQRWNLLNTNQATSQAYLNYFLSHFQLGRQ